DHSMARLYFPFDLLLSRLTREQVTDELRKELRAIYLQLAPSPTGKIQPRAKATRAQLAELTYVEGEKQLDLGRGPWSQIVFDEINAKEPILQSGWEALLEHCKSLQQQSPSAKWRKRADELSNAIGKSEVTLSLLRWLAMGPTPGQPPEARSPIEDSQYQKGIVWCSVSLQQTEIAKAIADFGLACLRKIRMIGAVSQKVGLACIQALGAIGSRDAIAQLTRMRAKIKYSTAQRLIEKSLLTAADNIGVSVHELEDYAVDGYGLDENGLVRFKVGTAQASLRLFENGPVTVTWQNAAGKVVRSVPSTVKKEFSSEVRSVSSTAKELEQAYHSQKYRLEASFLTAREMDINHWRQYFSEHPVLGFLGRRLIWVFREKQRSEQSALWLDGEPRDSLGRPVDSSCYDQVRLWHPLSTDPKEVQCWRDLVFQRGIRQPFKQAFREFYQMTDAERETRLYSNRFAGVLMRQHQFASLCKQRGWDYRLMGAHFDGFNVPTKRLDPWKIHAEFYVDLPSDRNPALLDSGLGEQSQAGINVLVGSDQVRFYREGREIALDEVPALVYSEIMRDVDLFTSVCAIGDDETWFDQGDRGIGVVFEKFDIGEVNATISLRMDLLSRVLPHTRIANRCRVERQWLEVRGQLGTYQIHLGWSGAALMADKSPRWLRIPQKILSDVDLGLKDLPIDLDYRTELALRKAYILADDWKINSPDLVRQLMPD
ncbi:MAG TPA: DUF4132 domain-containing protein, partial [Candidatus Bathyarchaeia archaeon]|nr:DUF4132 domain-containing protein [Candidatus Bathyarchaeia archaeon]